MSSLLPINWVIPIVVTAGGTLVSKLLESSHIFGKKDPTPYKTKVRIWAGLDYNRANAGRSSLGGMRPKIWLYDELGRDLGDTNFSKSKGGIPEGNFRDYEVEGWDWENWDPQTRPRSNARASYIVLSAGKLAILELDSWTRLS